VAQHWTRVAVVHKGGARELGWLRYVGTLHSATVAGGQWLGIELDAPHGKHNGSLRGETYFKCHQKHGIFVKPKHCRRVDLKEGDARMPSRLNHSRTKFGGYDTYVRGLTPHPSGRRKTKKKAKKETGAAATGAAKANSAASEGDEFFLDKIASGVEDTDEKARVVADEKERIKEIAAEMAAAAAAAAAAAEAPALDEAGADVGPPSDAEGGGEVAVAEEEGAGPADDALADAAEAAAIEAAVLDADDEPAAGDGAVAADAAVEVAAEAAAATEEERVGGAVQRAALSAFEALVSAEAEGSSAADEAAVDAAEEPAADAPAAEEAVPAVEEPMADAPPAEEEAPAAEVAAAEELAAGETAADAIAVGARVTTFAGPGVVSDVRESGGVVTVTLDWKLAQGQGATAHLNQASVALDGEAPAAAAAQEPAAAVDAEAEA
jgi:hypothetical protein